MAHSYQKLASNAYTIHRFHGPLKLTKMSKRKEMPRHSRIQHKRHPPLITECYYFLSSPAAIARHRQKRIQEMKRSRDIKLFPRRGNIYHVKRNISSFTAQFYCSPSVHREQYLNLSSHLAQEIPKKNSKFTA